MLISNKFQSVFYVFRFSKYRKIIYFLLGFYTFNSNLIYADLTKNKPLLDADMVIVGARSEIAMEKVAADITVITAEEIRRSGATTLTDVLRGISSVQISDNSTNTSISLRGFSAQQAGSNTLILLNGRRLNNSDLAAPQLAYINVDDIVRIEILNSSAGVLYGDQAVGGVINVITRNNEQTGTE